MTNLEFVQKILPGVVFRKFVNILLYILCFGFKNIFGFQVDFNIEREERALVGFKFVHSPEKYANTAESLVIILL